MHIKKCVVVLSTVTRAAEQDVGRNIFQNKWGTKARILVMVGGGHAALVRRCLIYLRRPSGQVRISKDLGSGIWGTWQGWRGGRSKVSLFDSAAVFGHCWGFPSCPFSRFLFCHSLCPVLHSCLPLCQQHWKCHILIHPHCTEQ